MILKVKQFFSNNLNYEINSQASGVAVDENNKEYNFSYCRTVPENCYILPSDYKDFDECIHGTFKFYENDEIGHYIEFKERK